VDPVPDPLLLRESGSAGNRTQELWICSQKLRPLDRRGGPLECKLLEYGNISRKRQRENIFNNNKTFFTTNKSACYTKSITRINLVLGYSDVFKMFFGKHLVSSYGCDSHAN
jgi:hypothetical protein